MVFYCIDCVVLRGLYCVVLRVLYCALCCGLYSGVIVHCVAIVFWIVLCCVVLY